ncbi:MAG: NAD-dependent epimerase/dehydratase family protein [Planctomycetota bacterium]
MNDDQYTPRCLVTGGAGFIGSHLVEHLLGLGRAVTVIDDLSTGRRENLGAVRDHPRLTFVHADAAEQLKNIGDGRPLGPFDEVYHLAAAVGVELVLRDPVGSIETNVGLTAAVASAALRTAPGGTAASLLLASSSEVYGKGTGAVFSESDDVLYGPTSVTRWSYAISKALDEYLVLETARQHDAPAVAVRFFNTIGPRQRGDYGMVVPRFVAAALAGEPLRVFGDGSQSRCFADVRDVVPALPRLLSSPDAHGRAVNIGSQSPITIARLAQIVIERTRSSSRSVLVPYADAYARGFEDLAKRRPDLTLAERLIGYAPSRKLEETIDNVAAWLAARGAPTDPQPAAEHPRADDIRLET